MRRGKLQSWQGIKQLIVNSLHVVSEMSGGGVFDSIDIVQVVGGFALHMGGNYSDLLDDFTGECKEFQTALFFVRRCV